jgi:signal transduction histidine kinase/CHASE3 domain sensor protein
MKSSYIYKSSFVIKIALAIAILLITYITVVFFRQMQNLNDSVELISVSNKRLLEMERIMSAVEDNDRATQSFLLTADSVYLKKHFIDLESLEPAFAKLTKYTDVKIRDSFSPDSLRELVRARYDLFYKLLQEVRPGEGNSRKALDLLAQSNSSTNQLRDYLSDVMSAESTNITHYEIRHSHELDTSIITSFFLVTIALFILLLSLNRINSDLKSLRKLNDELMFMNFKFINAEKIAGLSHWKYNLETKTYSLSDNFYSLIGIKPESTVPSLESIFPYLHPDDRQRVTEAYSDSFINKTPTSLIYRIYDKNGDMRYMKSIGSFAENSKGQLVKIGINYDITDQHHSTQELEEKNRNLMAINSELESFNNIVSHDLQEPLRKIQMFISRLDPADLEQMSEGGRLYFERIKQSAGRMQNLLVDLVNYSRAMKGEKAFETTNLNELLKEVVDEIQFNIQERNAEVFINELPTVNVIPLQIHQLFINLITNSLKFVREGVTPTIRVYNSPISSDEDFSWTDKPRSAHVKIVVEDNGIGFKQEFADKIFQLFRRLERNDQYVGTGIGLAICKKVAENHNGHITAQGRPGEGASFIIYLPK